MSRSRHLSGSAPSQRMLRVAELLRHAIAGLLARGQISDPVLDAHTVTVSRVRMSPDLKLATIYVMPLGGGDQAHVIAALERHKRYMRGEIAHEINLKFAPELRFRLDDSFDAAARIDALLSSGRVQRDLAPLDEEDGDAFDVDGANTENTQEGGSAR